MKCVICKTGEVQPASVQAELKIGRDRILVSVEAEACQQCGESYYSAEALRYLKRVREDFARKAITPASVGTVYQVSRASGLPPTLIPNSLYFARQSFGG